jgi:small-conductance mechanosensitive channel
MLLLLRLFASFLLVLTASSAFAATPVEAAPADASVIYMNREIVVLRAELAGASPAERVQRARQRIEEAEERNLAGKLVTLPVVLGSQQGIGVFAGDLLLFTVLPGDVSPEESRDAAATAMVAKQRLTDALAAWQAQQNPLLLSRALLAIAVASVLLVAAVWLGWRLKRLLIRRLAGVAQRHLHSDRPWLGYLVHVVERAILILVSLILLAFAYLWLTFVLAQFPLTQPFGRQLGEFLLDLLARIGSGFVSALPNLITLLVIILITRALVQSVEAIFDAIRNGRIDVPGLHVETLGATRRIVVVAIWALGITFCYPYVPGSQSDVFKGLSVLFGFMFTLGSAGVVSQMMSGMTLVYSRALRRGDMVQVGDMTGVVQEIGALSTKFVNLYKEEITIPNAVLVGNQIRNLSRLHETEGVRIGTCITIGYDTPWRQVHAMMLNAAERVPGLRKTPTPYVLQRALSDFYAEYELIAVLEDPFERPQILSAVHAEIQDEFNRHGVQIMSPHFAGEAQQPVRVPEADWFRAPAKRN